MIAMNVMVIQSRQTGRFLLKKTDEVWSFPSVVVNDYQQPVVYLAMEDVGEALGQDVEENGWLLDFIADNDHQLFHVWVDGEPKGPNIADRLEWCSLFLFPEKTDPIVSKILSNRILLEKSLTPES